MNSELGPKKVTSESYNQEIGKIIYQKTGHIFEDVKIEKEITRIDVPNPRILPQRKEIPNIGSTFKTNKSILSMHEKQMRNLELALTKMPCEDIKKFTVENRAAQKVYQPFIEQEYKRKPLTRLEKNMLLYREIFIIPEENRIVQLKEKEKDFTD